MNIDDHPQSPSVARKTILPPGQGWRPRRALDFLVPWGSATETERLVVPDAPGTKLRSNERRPESVETVTKPPPPMYATRTGSEKPREAADIGDFYAPFVGSDYLACGAFDFLVPRDSATPAKKNE